MKEQTDRDKTSSSNSSRISTRSVQLIMEKLLSQTNRSSTAASYLRIWRQFNRFVIKLDVKPSNWEDRVTLFIAYKIQEDMQSTTVKSYISAIKKTLIDDGYAWDDQRVLVGSLTRACKLVNDRVMTRLPIHCGLLKVLLFEVQSIYANNGQQYIQLMYKTLFALSFYGMMRACKVTKVPNINHVLKAKDVHAVGNKDKILLILHSSKTHDSSMRPQRIKIISNISEKSGSYSRRHFCAFALTSQYISMRGDYDKDNEKFFIFSDGSPVTAEYAREVLKLVLTNIGLDPFNYGMHSFRVGRTSDLIKYNYSLEEMKCMGRWCSNTVYKYIR